MALRNGEMRTVFGDNLRQHGAGTLKHRNAPLAAIFRIRHLFNHVVIKAAEAIGTLACLIGTQPQPFKGLTAGFQRRFEGLTLRILNAHLTQANIVIDIAGAGNNAQVREVLLRQLR